MAATDPTLDQLAPRGTAADSDLIPTLPAGGTTLMNQTVANLRAGVTNSVAQFGPIDPTGVADSTFAFQAALASGQSFTVPPGVFKISANLALTAAINHGQIITGAGTGAGISETYEASSGYNKTILKPTSAVTTLFTIDGTPFDWYLQGFAFRDFCVDMAEMADVATNSAFRQIMAFGGEYSNVQVMNYGANKLSWLFETGAFTTEMRNCTGGAVRFQGTTINDAVTTITLTNCDILSIGGNYYGTCTLVGGAVQQPYTSAVPISYLPPGTSPYVYLPNTAGLYVAALSTLQNCYSFSSIGTDWEQGGGFPTTYNDGVHGVLPLICVLAVEGTAQNTSFVNPTLSGMYVLDSSTTTSIIGQNFSVVGGDFSSRPTYHLGTTNIKGSLIGFTDLPSYLDTNTTITFQITASTGQAQFTGAVIKPTTDNNTVFQINTAEGAQVVDVATSSGSSSGLLLLNNGCGINGYTDNATTQTWSLNSLTGAFDAQSAFLKPHIDGNGILQISNAAGASILSVGTNATVGNSGFLFGNGIGVYGYSDSYSTVSWQISCATGAFSAGATILKPASDGNVLTVQNHAGIDFIIAYSSSTIGASSLDLGNGASLIGFSDSFGTQKFVLDGATGRLIQPTPPTVASLPSASLSAFSRLFVTDSTVAAAGNFGAVVVGGGSHTVPVWGDGTNWYIG